MPSTMVRAISSRAFWLTSLCLLISIGAGLSTGDPAKDNNIEANSTDKEREPDAVYSLPNAEDSIALAYADLLTLPPYSQCYIRYLFLDDAMLPGWLPDKTMSSAKTTSLGINYISRAGGVLKPYIVPQSRGFLLRIDLRWYAPIVDDLKEWIDFWEELQYDPAYSLLLTKTTIKSANLDKRFIEELARDECTPLWLRNALLHGKDGVPGPPKIEIEVQGPPVQDPIKKFRKAKKTRLVPQPDRIENRKIYHSGGELIVPDDYRWSAGIRAPGDYTIKHYFKVPARVEEYEIDEEYREEVGNQSQDGEKPSSSARARQIPAKDASATNQQKIDVVRFNSRGINHDLYCKLQHLTHSKAPVVSHRYFKGRVLNTIKDGRAVKNDNVYRTIFGGLYYEFRGIKKAKDVLGADTKATDLDLFLENLGIGNIKAGLNSDQLFNKPTLRSDQAFVIFRSKVTAKPREVLSFHLPSGRAGGSWGSITGDIADEDIDIDSHPVMNLLNFKRAAREAIFPDAKDLLVFALFNGDGALQDEVPFNIANDYMIPRPHSQRLQIMGCIVCHSVDGKDGWQDFSNDVLKILRRLDIFDDLSAEGFHRERKIKAPGIDLHRPRHLSGFGTLTLDQIDRIAHKYTGNPEVGFKNLSRARDDLSESTMKATGPWVDPKGKPIDQTQVCRLAAQRIWDEYTTYHFDQVDAHTALKELGLYVPKNLSVEMWKRLLTPDPRAVAFDNRDGKSFVLEDPRLGALSEGISINRVDWSLCRDFAFERLSCNPLFRTMRAKGIKPSVR